MWERGFCTVPGVLWVSAADDRRVAGLSEPAGQRTSEIPASQDPDLIRPRTRDTLQRKDCQWHDVQGGTEVVQKLGQIYFGPTSIL